MAIKVYNTLSRTKEDFIPLDDKKVGMYVCGPTVYKHSHIGHMVGPVIFDTIRRYLAYKDYDVRVVINITDVDDKIIKRSYEENIPMEDIVKDVTDNYLENLRALNVDIDTITMPYATQHIGDIIAMVKGLIDKGYAYEADGNVYFDITKKSDYGKLSNRRPEELLAGASVRNETSPQGGRVLPGEHKKNAGDFAVWKKAKAGEPSWDSPWGKGRPGWHIECSAMSMRYLGESFDIHGGGVDLVFPHHENEIAQSEAFSGKPFAKYWMHNGLTQMGGQKMSKSLGNLITISELLEKYPPEVVRFFLLATHYRSPIDFSDERIEEVRGALKGFYRLFNRIKEIAGVDVYDAEHASTCCGDASTDACGDIQDEAGKTFCEEMKNAKKDFEAAMDDDFNTAGAIGALFVLLRETNKFLDESGLDERKPTETEQGLIASAAGVFKKLGGVLGVFQKKQVSLAATASVKVKLAAKKINGKSDYDRLLEILKTNNVSSEGFDELGSDAERFKEGVERLIDARNHYRKKKKFDKADAIRDDLAKLNIILEDKPGKTDWHFED